MATIDMTASSSLLAHNNGMMMMKKQKHHRSCRSLFVASCSVHRLFLLFLGQSLVVFAFVSFLLQHHVQLEKEYQAVQSQLQQFHHQHQQHEKNNMDSSVLMLSGRFNSSTTTSNSTIIASSALSTTSRKILFVHVGKTGGETVKKVLRLGCEVRKNVAQRAECWKNDFDVATESKLSQLVHGYFHYRKMHPSNAALVATHYLYTLRHPVQRLQSWFRYITPINCPIPLEPKLNDANTTTTNMMIDNDNPVLHRLMSCRIRQTVVDNPDSWEARFFACFPSLEFMAKGLTLKSDSSPSRCTRMLRHVLNGQGGQQGDTGQDVVGHLAANYQYYHRHTIGLISPPPSGRPAAELVDNTAAAVNRTILVLRTESLWEDLKELDIFLGGNGYFRKDGLRVSHVHNDQHQQQAQQEHKVLYKDAAVLSPHGGKLLCCAMHEELAVYRELLLRAANLNATQKNKTLSAALQLCRATSWQGLVKACGMQKSKLLLEIAA